MKRTLALATIVALSLSLGSCRKKNNEPIAPKPNTEKPAPTPGTNPNPGTNPAPTPTPIPAPPTPVNGDNNNTIKPDESPVNATVSIKLTKGARVTIKSDKPLTITGAKLTETQHTYEVTNESGFGIDGDPETLDLSIAQATEFALDKEMPSLKSLKITTEESLKKLSLQGAKNLEQLDIAGAIADEQTLDLSKHSKLRLLALGNRPDMIGKFTTNLGKEYPSINSSNPSTSTSFKEVSLPTSLEVLFLAKAYCALVGADNLPNLRAAYIYTPKAELLGDLSFAGSTNLDRLMLAYTSGGGALNSLTIKNKPHLRDLFLYRMTIKHTSIDGLPANTSMYKTSTNTNYNLPSIEVHNSPAGKILFLLQLATNLKSADLTNNPDLTEEKLVKIAEKLTAVKGVNLKIEADKATDAVKDAFQKIGWTVNK